MREAVTFAGSFMQSFTSMGPMLDIVALFSAIAFYSGIYLGIVMLLSFCSALSAMYVIKSLSKKFQSNGGYYLFAGEALGKDIGIFTSFIYTSYALLTIPSISLFVSYFVLNTFLKGTHFAAFFNYIIPFAFLLSIVGIVYLGLGRSIKYTLVAGIIEFAFITILDVLFFKHGTASVLSIFPVNLHAVTSVFTGVVFGVLVFSGMESPVYLSENTEERRRTVPRALVYSYLATGFLLVISAFSILLFLGSEGLEKYTSSPLVIENHIRIIFGPAVYILFLILAILSSLNLCVAYSNSVLNEIRRMSEDRILPMIRGNWKNIVITYFILEGAIGLIANVFLGSFLGFVVIAAIVSFSYMAVQFIGGLSLIWLSANSGRIKPFLIALFSVIVISLTLIFSLYIDIFGNGPTRISIVAFLIILIVSFSISYAGKVEFPEWYDGIVMFNSIKEADDIN
ncbi:MAG: APC family permease [Thermoplasmatales archaeon]